MQYYSTNHIASKVSFKQAMFRSEAADGSLYLPEKLPLLPNAVINNLRLMSLRDISFIINNTFFGDDLSSSKIKDISDEVCSYNMPLYEIEKGIYVMELFHGPTKTVKDFGAMMLMRMVRQLLADTDMPLNVMVATTGHSGKAIATAFNDLDRVNVFALYPKGLAKHHVDYINSLGENIHSIEVNGSIDQCVRMIHQAFEDKQINKDMLLTSANSMNMGSLLPSTIPFFYAYAQLMNKNSRPGDIFISVPSGNCGNLLAGYIAKKMGLPVNKLIAACNSNAGFHKYLTTGVYDKSGYSLSTLAYGMDMPYSANVPRFEALCDNDIEALRRDIVSEACSDHDIKHTINDVYERTGYLFDPHAAVAYKALKRNLPEGASGIVMATAHPSLSADIMSKINFGGLKLPFLIKNKEPNYCSRPELSIPPAYGALKKVLNYYRDEALNQSSLA